jgi:hypothetical protein
LAAALLAGCAGRPAPAPPPAPAAAPPPAAVLVDPTPAATAPDWTLSPLTPGEWSYAGEAGGSEARFAGFGLRCDPGRREVIVSGPAGGRLRVRTSYGERTLAAGAALPAADPLLDEMAFSRGRFAVETEGLETLVVPAWPEPARVIEDCRG